MTTSTCKAKNPDTCPYHGSGGKGVFSLSDSLKKMFGSPPAPFFKVPVFGENQEEFNATISITPANSNAKRKHVVKIVSKDYDTLIEKVNKEIDRIGAGGVDLPDLKSGYEAKVMLPTSSTDSSVNTQINTAFTSRPLPEILDSVKRGVKERTQSNSLADGAIEQLQDSTLGQTFAGAKGIGLMRTMAKFQFFQGKYAHHDTNSAWNSLVERGAGEYTNRGYGIRVHPSYDKTGELSEVMFSLDDPNSRWNTFSKEQVDAANKELNSYFKRVDALNPLKN